MAGPRKTKSMTLIQNFYDLVILYASLKTPLVYLFTNIKRSFSIFLVHKKTICGSFSNFLEIISNVIHDLNLFPRTWQFAYLFLIMLLYYQEKPRV